MVNIQNIMNKLCKVLALTLISAGTVISASAEDLSAVSFLVSGDMPDVEEESTVVKSEEYEYTPTEKPAFNDDIWKFKRKFMLSFTTGTLDQKSRLGGEIDSRWGVSLISGQNIYLHRKPIGGFLRFGLNLEADINYLNFAKGNGTFSDLIHSGGSDDVQATLGRHYLTIGVSLGPTASFAPFFASANRKLAALTFRPYFHAVPSYAAYIVSDDDDVEFYNAFAFFCAAGMEIQWKRLIFGVEWKGSTAKYKGLSEDIMADMDEDYEADKPHKFDMNMVNISIGFAF